MNRWLWSIYSKFYDTLLDLPLYRELLSQVIECLDLEPGNTLLDAGCGTGNLEKEILSGKDKSLKIEAIDLSPQMLEISKEKVGNKVRFKQVDLNQAMDYVDNSFDRIAMIHVLYALRTPKQTIKELHRVLRPGGILVIANPRHNASLTQLMKANYLRLDPSRRPSFVFRISLAFVLNIFIANAGRSGYYHFWERQDWEAVLQVVGFSHFTVSLAYADQDYLIKARKEN